MSVLMEIQRRYPGQVEIFDATDILCERPLNVCSSARGKRALYSYSDHVSDYAAGMIGRELNAFLAAR